MCRNLVGLNFWICHNKFILKFIFQLSASHYYVYQSRALKCFVLYLLFIANYDELLKIEIPAKGPEREFFLAMRDFFQEVVGEVSLHISNHLTLNSVQSAADGWV